MPKGARVGRRIRSKYGSVRETIDNIVFASQKEGERYRQLKILLAANRIRNLRWQVRYTITIRSVKICVYVADFVFEEYRGPNLWPEVVEDTKGVKTPEYRLKKKLMAACLGIIIRES